MYTRCIRHVKQRNTRPDAFRDASLTPSLAFRHPKHRTRDSGVLRRESTVLFARHPRRKASQHTPRCPATHWTRSLRTRATTDANRHSSETIGSFNGSSWVRVGAFEMKQQMEGALSGKVFAPTKEPAKGAPWRAFYTSCSASRSLTQSERGANVAASAAFNATRQVGGCRGCRIRHGFECDGVTPRRFPWCVVRFSFDALGDGDWLRARAVMPPIILSPRRERRPRPIFSRAVSSLTSIRWPKLAQLPRSRSAGMALGSGR